MSVRNGWDFALSDMTVKWELFSKTGKTSSSIVLLKAGEVTGINLGPGQSTEFETPLIEFRATESDTEGFTGNKYYGYRLRFFYRNTEVRSVALPEQLSEWQSQ